MAAEDPTSTAATCGRRSPAARHPSWRLEMQIMPLRGRGRLPLQPVRPDEGLAARGLPADHDRPAGARPQPGELLRPGRAGRVRALEHGAGHRAEPGQDAAGADVRLPRHPPPPDRHATTSSCRSTTQVARAHLQQGRRDDVPACRRRSPSTRPTATGARGRPDRYGDPGWLVGAARSCAPPTTCTRRTTTSARPARSTAT